MERRTFFFRAGAVLFALLPAAIAKSSADQRRRMARYTDGGLDPEKSGSVKQHRFGAKKVECASCYFLDAKSMHCDFLSATVSPQGSCTAWIFR